MKTQNNRKSNPKRNKAVFAALTAALLCGGFVKTPPSAAQIPFLPSFPGSGIVDRALNGGDIGDILGAIPYAGTYFRLAEEIFNGNLGAIPYVGSYVNMGERILSGDLSAIPYAGSYLGSAGDYVDYSASAVGDVGGFDQLNFDASDYAIGDGMSFYETTSLVFFQKGRSANVELIYGSGSRSPLFQGDFIKFCYPLRADFACANAVSQELNPRQAQTTPNGYRQQNAEELEKNKKELETLLSATQENEKALAFAGETIYSRRREFLNAPAELQQLLGRFRNAPDVTDEGNLFAASTLTRYGFAYLRSDGLKKHAEKFFAAADELVLARYSNTSMKYGQWKNYLAVNAQFAGEYERAEKYFKEANDILKAYKVYKTPADQANWCEYARNVETMGRFYLAIRRFKDAAPAVEETVELYSKGTTTPTKILYAEALANRGLVQFFNERDYDSSVDLQKAAELYAEIARTPRPAGNDANSASLVEILDRAFMKQNAIYCRLAQLSARVEKYDEAEEFLTKAREGKKAQIEVWRNSADSAKYFGKNPLFSQGFYRPSKTRGFYDVIEVDSGKIVPLKLNEKQLAEKEEAWNKICDGYYFLEDTISASMDYKRGEFDKALQKTTEILRRLEANELQDSGFAFETFLARAQIERRLGGVEQLTAAQSDLDRAAEILEKDANYYLQGVLDCERGNVAFDLAEFESPKENLASADKYYRSAEEIFTKANASNALLIELYYGQARLRRALGESESAYRTLDSAIERSIDIRKTSCVDEEDKAVRFSQYYYLFETKTAWLVEDAADGNVDAEKIYNAMEISRAQSFQDLALQAGVDWSSDVAPELKANLQKSEQALLAAQMELSRKTSKLASSQKDEELEKLRKNVKDARAKFDVALNAVKSASAQRANLLDSKRKPCDFATLKQELAESKTFVCEYLIGEHNAYLLTYGANFEPRAYVLNVGEEESSLLREKGDLAIEPGALTADKLSELLKNAKLTGASSRGSLKAQRVAALYNALWRILIPEETRQILCGDDADFHLLIVPDGALAQLSFEALVVDGGDDNFSSPSYLLDQKPVALYAPSATIYDQLTNEKRRDAESTALSVGNPKYAQEAHLVSLPGTEKEVEKIVEICRNAPSKVDVISFLQDDATERNVTSNIAKTYAHLASHSVVNFQLGKRSGSIALTPGQSDEGKIETNNDGYLTLAEMFKLNLSGNELVALSACETNLGEKRQGEGVWSLGRGMMVAGARRVVVSNWSVSDKSTAELISTFFQQIFAKEDDRTVDFAVALKEAKLATKQGGSQNKWSDPYYWAPFVLIGAR